MPHTVDAERRAATASRRSDRSRDPACAAGARSAAAGGLARRRVGEEPVDARAGAADVGAEGAELAQPLRERRRGEVVRRQAPRDRAAARTAGERARAARPAAPRTRRPRPGRRTARTPSPVEAFVTPAGRTSTTQKSCGRSSGVEDRPVARAELRAVGRGRTARRRRSSRRARRAGPARAARGAARSRAEARRLRPSCRRRARPRRGSPS